MLDAISDLVNLIHAIVLFLVWLMIAAFFSMWQAVAGSLYPAKTARMKRYQKFAAACLLTALALLAAGACVLYFSEHATPGLITLVGGALIMLAAGLFGRLAESEFNRSKGA